MTVHESGGAMSGRRIAVDARPLCHPGTGICRYTRELLTRMCRLGGEWFLYAHQAYDSAGLDLPNVHHRVADLPPALRTSQLALFFFPRWARRDRVEVFWGPRHQLPALPDRVRAVLTVHDMVWKDCGATMRFPGRQIESFYMPRALAAADDICVVSQFTRRRLEHHFPQHSARVTVVPGASMLAGEAATGRFTPPAQRGDYFLFVGTLEPRKNLPRLLRAYGRFVAATPRACPLRIAGGAGWGDEDIARLVADQGLSSHVQLLGRVDDIALRDLYRGAYALLMPSLYEGFGLPVVEALSAGVPVVTSRDSAMAEVAAGAGLYVDPRSEDELVQALATIFGDRERYSSLRERSLVEASRYSWELSSKVMSGLLFR